MHHFRETAYAHERSMRVLSLALGTPFYRGFVLQEAQNILFLQAMVSRLASCSPSKVVVRFPLFRRPGAQEEPTKEESSFEAPGSKRTSPDASTKQTLDIDFAGPEIEGVSWTTIDILCLRSTRRWIQWLKVLLQCSL